MRQKALDPPNLMVCSRSMCDWVEEYHEGMEKPKRCPKCGDKARRAFVMIACGAWKRGRKAKCHAYVAVGKRCRLHGLKAAKGPNSGTFKDGKYSKYVPYIPERYEETFQAALEDRHVQREMRDQLAILAALQDEIIARVGTGESGQAWRELEETAKKIGSMVCKIKSVREDHHIVARVISLLEEELLPVIECGVEEEHGRRELVELFERRARLIRVQQQGEEVVSQKELQLREAALQARYVALVQRYLPREALVEFAAELRGEKA